MKRRDFFAGILVGATIFGGSTAIASGVMATLSPNQIYVDGELVTLTAYAIGGNNYVKLRDIGEAVDFDVAYNTAMNAVQITSDSPYIGEDIKVAIGVTESTTTSTGTTTTNTTVAEMLTVVENNKFSARTGYDILIDNTTTQGQLANGKDITEENILAVMDEIAEIFPNGTSWGATYNTGDLYWYRNGGGCNSYAWMVRDLLYGAECQTTSTHNDLSQAKVGDVIYLKNNTTGSEHWTVVSGLGYSSTGTPIIYMMNGNVNAKVSLASPYYLGAAQTNFPDSTIYSYYD